MKKLNRQNSRTSNINNMKNDEHSELNSFGDTNTKIFLNQQEMKLL